MKRILLFSLSLCFISFIHAQKKEKQVTAYAITGMQKGATSWTEVRLIDVATGEELQTIYASSSDAEILNARTGKAVAKKDGIVNTSVTTTQTPETVTQIVKKDGNNIVVIGRSLKTARQPYDQPFATTSAACAYDKKHSRLYYTPMGINQLRYIDLKAKSPKVYYFEEEAFGVVKGRGDVSAQITRMVMGADGNGYALSNDGNHLIQFTTKKNPVITDLGALTDDATNGRFSVHSASSYGGDMVADKQGNLYLVTANHAVYKINIESKLASYIGSIKGLPRGFSTNGAIAEGDSKVVVSSSGSTEGYYHFDLNTLQAEKISGGSAVFNASDLANASFAFEKKNKDEDKPKDEVKDELITVAATKNPAPLDGAVIRNAISVYPNPVTEGAFKLSFADQKPGRYQIQFLDATGKLISTQTATIVSKYQVEEFRLPQKVAAGNYLVKVMSDDGSYANTNKLIVQ